MFPVVLLDDISTDLMLNIPVNDVLAMDMHTLSTFSFFL